AAAAEAAAEHAGIPGEEAHRLFAPMYDLLTSGVDVRARDIEALLERLDKEIGVPDADTAQAAKRRRNPEARTFEAINDPRQGNLAQAAAAQPTSAASAKAISSP